MYFVTKRTVEIENTIHEEFGVSCGENNIIFFTSDIKEAEMLAELLNENEVEPNHVADIIEDLFYT